MTYEWKPGEKLSELLSIREPPCKYCRRWTPKIKESWLINYCSAEKMFQDFSCFRIDKSIGTAKE